MPEWFHRWRHSIRKRRGKPVRYASPTVALVADLAAHLCSRRPYPLCGKPFHRHDSTKHREEHRTLILAQPQSAVSQPVKEAFLSMRQAAEASGD